jgi:hypothetical protein
MGDSLLATCPVFGGHLQPRLSSLRRTAAGWVGLASCNSCSHKAPLPVEQRIRKHGELAMVEVGLVSLRCIECNGYGATVLMLKLCEPGAETAMKATAIIG